jgi:hypothetical protein
LPTKEDSPLSVEERFGELFKAARVLLEDGAGEDQIIPTLALANLVGQGVPRLVAQKERLVELRNDEQVWDKEADRFARRYSGLRPVRVAGEVLILERLSVFVGITYDTRRNSPEGVAVSVCPHRTLVEPEEAASLYDKALSKAGVPHEARTGNLSFDIENDRLVISIWPGTVAERIEEPQPGWRLDNAPFPHPRLVRQFYAVAREEFRRELAARRAGPKPEADNLVPACVAFLLRNYGIRGRKKIHKLLNKHVLSNTWKGLPEDGYGNSATYQLWKDVKNRAKVGGPLMDASWTLFWEGAEL